ncbi:hypothetical protein [Tychonema bourrellyi]|nr:hypothetical protein [Tychonema bourrellyi]
MKALEVTGKIDEKGQLLLDRPLTARCIIAVLKKVRYARCPMPDAR